MSDASPGTANAAQAAAPARRTIIATLLHAAWLAVGLGLSIEVLLVVVAAGFGSLRDFSPFLADLVQKITWAELVCVGVAIGTAAAKARPAVMGILGLFSAPLGFYAARAAHKSATHALGVAGPAAGGVSPVTIAMIRAVEYACLGAAQGWLSERTAGRFRTYVYVGIAAGVVFGGFVLILTIVTSPQMPSVQAILARAVNEIVFPVGCSMVVYAAQALARVTAAPTTSGSA
jgi:hypothetical protein